MRRTLFEADHETYRESVRTMLEREVVPYYPEWERAGIVPRALFVTAGSLGMFAAVPETYGGAGVRDFRFNAVVLEESAALGVAPAMAGPSLQADVVLPYLLHLTTEEQRGRWLPGIATGQVIAAVAMTEPGTGSDLSGIRTTARREGDHYVVNGTKTFITNGINADLVVTAVRTGDHPHRGLSLLVLERGMDGFTRGRNLDKIGQHAQDTAELSLADVRVPVANRLGAEGAGFAGLTGNLVQERLSVAIGAVAQARAAFTATVGHVRDRHAFGAPIGALQNTRFRLAEMDTELDLAQHFLDRCVEELNAGELSAVDAAKAKWWSTELQGRVVDACVQLHGGYGYMLEYPVARAYADARVSRIYGGTTEIMKEIVGRALELAP
ncbi:acyl-CoA dehydrogenase family protein [Amycolatopsis rifamycinica]|uniref:Acyl-[acyl-carrier-protein] dehydrogenase MbtN n=1 Tax=Amycolatopsis rifamycinica TaxID=287986 RepID=A0A066U405_9PSEU|nr:acyl-CoA dehydrogenase family protein [Amycolatopsis rifamycinica]KDN21825.1 acyl-CoA dehydrogenase [Amycolatopsis rifamycinica]